MLRSDRQIGVEWAYAPRWRWRAVGFAALSTLLLYVALPYLERLSAPVQPVVALRSVTTVAPPVPLPPPPEVPETPPPEQRALPVLEVPPRPLVLPPAHLQLQTGIGALVGDFAWGIDQGDLALTEEDGIFALGDLDTPPQPMVQLRPQYPPQARLRQQEGYVTVEFVVDAEGAVQSAVVVAAEPPEVFEQAALRAVARWRFSPGIRQGQAVAVRVRQRVEFRLQ